MRIYYLLTVLWQYTHIDNKVFNIILSMERVAFDV